MPRKVPEVKHLLKQLTREELLKLAKQKKLREIPANWTKEKIVNALLLNVKPSDITSLTRHKIKAKNPQVMGYKVRELGEKLERKVVSLLTSKGYKCEKNVRRRGAEFDVICFKKGGIFSDDEWIFVECKNKEKVIPADFKKFLGNFEIFCSEEKLDKNKVEGILYTTGVFDPEVKRQAREISNIKLKRIKLT